MPPPFSRASLNADIDPANRAFLEALSGARVGPSWSNGHGAVAVPDAPQSLPHANGAATSQEVVDSVRAIMLIRAYRVCGHLIADLDPLGLQKDTTHPELDPATYGFGPQDYDRPIFIDNVLGLTRAPLREILAVLQRTYCGRLGVEFMHLTNPEEKSWVQRRVEAPRPALSADAKRALLKKLMEVEGFEKFLARKYTGTKKFGLDGSESMIPAIDCMLAEAASLGVHDAVVGMAHRGRLNVLAHILSKPAAAIFHEFAGGSNYPDDVEGSGDVKYHLGASADRIFDNHVLHVSLSANPSHLEAVDPVVLGKSRAKQDQHGDKTRRNVMPLLIHGDAAFAGQGVVAECMAMSGLKGHRTDGSVHLIINNQIGFTTAPHNARSSPYPSDVAKTAGAPIFHVNGDDPESVLYACALATQFRHAFKKPALVDLFCYRRFGHNESDEPMFTQPLMYQKIRRHRSVPALYATRLAEEGVLSAKESTEFSAEVNQEFERAYATRHKPPDDSVINWLGGRWEGYGRATGSVRRGQTGFSRSGLRALAREIYNLPESFTPHPMAKKLLSTRLENIEAGESIDWAEAEHLAFASLLREGFAVRLVGQDSERGTFSQRHSVLLDQKTEKRFIPLSQVKPETKGKTQHWGGFEVVNSLLSEEAVLGFEFGYSLQAPGALCLWEAQFGDFANTAQNIIDQFIVSGESKWLRMSGLVMLLPHGYEGQGPEHSSARLERFLQLCGQDNIQVANCTTPANYFHILRRQLHRPFRKPLVLMTPKSLLRHPDCRSSIEDFAARTSFHRILPDEDLKAGKLNPPSEIRRLVLCSGKVYYDLLAHRRELENKSVYLLRLEQFYPFPMRTVARELARFPNARLIWCQEEPKNMGGWQFVQPYLLEAAKIAGVKPHFNYAGRPAAASPASGFLAAHKRETEKIMHDVFSLRLRGEAESARKGAKSA